MRVPPEAESLTHYQERLLLKRQPLLFGEHLSLVPVSQCVPACPTCPSAAGRNIPPRPSSRICRGSHRRKVSTFSKNNMTRPPRPKTPHRRSQIQTRSPSTHLRRRTGSLAQAIAIRRRSIPARRRSLSTAISARADLAPTPRHLPETVGP